MTAVIALTLLLLLPYLGFFTGLTHRRPLSPVTYLGLALGATGTIVLLWPLRVPPLPRLWPEPLAFPVALAGWVALCIGAIVRLRLDRSG